MSGSVMAEGNLMKIDGSCTLAPAAAPPLPPTQQPRVKEVRSRFMSPAVSVLFSTSSGDLHMLTDRSPLHKHSLRSSSVQRRWNQLEAEVLGSAGENRLEVGRSLPVAPRKLQQRAAVNMFKENIEGRVKHKNIGCDGFVRSSGEIEIVFKFMATKRRQDTPIVSSSFDKAQQNRLYRGTSAAGSATPTAIRQLQLGAMTSSA